MKEMTLSDSNTTKAGQEQTHIPRSRVGKKKRRDRRGENYLKREGYGALCGFLTKSGVNSFFDSRPHGPNA